MERGKERGETHLLSRNSVARDSRSFTNVLEGKKESGLVLHSKIGSRKVKSKNSLGGYLLRDYRVGAITRVSKCNPHHE